MTTVIVLGSGCKKCTKTAELIEKTASELGVAVTVTKETDLATIMQWGVLATPGVVVDETLVHSGSVPSSDTIKSWLAS